MERQQSFNFLSMRYIDEINRGEAVLRYLWLMRDELSKISGEINELSLKLKAKGLINEERGLMAKQGLSPDRK
jgi:hypothetical protein